MPHVRHSGPGGRWLDPPTGLPGGPRLPVAGGEVGVSGRLEVELAGLRLKNPVMVASGTFGYGREYADFFDLNRLGAVMVKGVSIEPWPGNPLPRMAETPAGMLNAIGLQNPGVDWFIAEDLPFLRDAGVPVIVNIIGKTVDEYAAVAARLDRAEGVSAIEINI